MTGESGALRNITAIVRTDRLEDLEAQLRRSGVPGTGARAGATVVVHEQRAQVGSRFHDDFQGLESCPPDRTCCTN
jgi:hypothetical protein